MFAELVVNCLDREDSLLLAVFGAANTVKRAKEVSFCMRERGTEEERRAS